MPMRNVNEAAVATDCDGCGQYMWMCHVGVAVVPDGNLSLWGVGKCL